MSMLLVKVVSLNESDEFLRLFPVLPIITINFYYLLIFQLLMNLHSGLERVELLLHIAQ